MDNTSLRTRLNYSDEVEAAINRQINNELSASYMYLAMVCLSSSEHLNNFDILGEFLWTG